MHSTGHSRPHLSVLLRQFEHTLERGFYLILEQYVKLRIIYFRSNQVVHRLY
jgi:hypothetical protein